MATQADLDELDATIRRLRTSGIRTATYNGRTLTYRDLSELQAQRDLIAAELADTDSGTQSRTWFANPGKGL
jgi:hypothetical protein